MDYSKVLETYTLEEIIEWNDLANEDVLSYLVEQEFIKLPNPEPLDFE